MTWLQYKFRYQWLALEMPKSKVTSEASSIDRPAPLNGTSLKEKQRGAVLIYQTHLAYWLYL